MVLNVTPVGYYPNSGAAPLGRLLSVLSAPSQPVFAFWSPVAGNSAPGMAPFFLGTCMLTVEPSKSPLIRSCA